MSWVDIFEKAINALTNPTTIGAIATGWLGFRTNKSWKSQQGTIQGVER